MRDYQDVIVKFVKIVERYPEIYDSRHDAYRTRYAELAWDKIAESVRSELHEECSVEEIKTKWKGIRSSYNRFKNKLTRGKGSSQNISSIRDTGVPKKYYLYDTLHFLAPFTKRKTNIQHLQDGQLQEKNTSEDCLNSDDDSIRDDYATDVMESWEATVKSEAEDEDENLLNTNDVLGLNWEEIQGSKIDTSKIPSIDLISSVNSMPEDKAKKRKCEESTDGNLPESEDLQFFKSILPDIKDFSVKEKRKLKMGILKLIDDIEDSRQEIREVHDVSSSKIKSL